MFEWVGEWIRQLRVLAAEWVKLTQPLRTSLVSARLLQSPLLISLKVQSKQSHRSSSCSLSCICLCRGCRGWKGSEAYE